jgi:dsDNA-specific endonuclease/ATPase MutS2
MQIREKLVALLASIDDRIDEIKKHPTLQERLAKIHEINDRMVLLQAETSRHKDPSVAREVTSAAETLIDLSTEIQPIFEQMQQLKQKKESAERLLSMLDRSYNLDDEMRVILNSMITNLTNMLKFTENFNK